MIYGKNHTTDLFSQDFLGKEGYNLVKKWEMFGISDMKKEVCSMQLQRAVGVLHYRGWQCERIFIGSGQLGRV